MTAPVGAPKTSATAIARALGLICFATYAYFQSPASWNENARFDLTRSLVERGRFDIEPYHANTGDKSFGRGGLHYCDKAPGLSLAAALPYGVFVAAARLFHRPLPAMAIVGRDGVSDPALVRGDGEDDVMISPAYIRALHLVTTFTVAIAGAWVVMLLFDLLFAWGMGLTAALTSALALGVGSLLLPYATMFYGHVPAAALAFASFRRVALASRDNVSAKDEGRACLIAGALAGAAVAVEYPAAIVLVVLFARLARERFKERALPFAAGALVPLALLMAYHALAFGGPLRSGYASVTRPEFASAMSSGFFGIAVPRPSVVFSVLVGRARGLLYVAPVGALGFAGLLRAWRATGKRARHQTHADNTSATAGASVDENVRSRSTNVATAVVMVAQRADVATATVVVVAFLALCAGYGMWWGGAALGPRHFIPALPFLSLGVAWTVTRARGLACALLAISAANLLMATAVGAEAPFATDVLFGYVWSHVWAGQIPALVSAGNIGTSFGLHGLASVAPIVALWVAGAAVIARLVRRAAVAAGTRS